MASLQLLQTLAGTLQQIIPAFGLGDPGRLVRQLREAFPEPGQRGQGKLALHFDGCRFNVPRQLVRVDRFADPRERDRYGRSTAGQKRRDSASDFSSGPSISSNAMGGYN